MKSSFDGWYRRTGLWIGLVPIAITVVALAVGVSTASATLLCQTTTCTPYVTGTALKASLAEGTQAVLLASPGNVECKSSTIAGKTTAEAGKPLSLEVSGVTFAECKLGGSGCSATTTSLPTAPSLEASGGGNGTLSLEGGEVHFVCSGWIDCTYKTPALHVKGGAPASLSAEGVALTKVGGALCGVGTAKFDATYTVSEPNPAYLVM
jgi:hypothetical protein